MVYETANFDGNSSTLVWQLHHPLHQTIDCMAGHRPDGRIEVVVEQAPAMIAGERGVFPDATAAVRWAFELQGTLISQGWIKVV